MRIAIVATLLFATAVVAQENKPTEVKWLTDFEQAKATAKKENKVVLADFTGSDWCGWCIKLKNEVFSKPEFATWAAKNVVLLEVDFPHNIQQSDELQEQNKELARRYGIRGYPTIVFLNAEGKQLGQQGYEPGGPAVWTKHADEKIKGNGADGAITDTASEEGWITSYKDALAKAKKEDKVVIVDFTGSDWCHFCKELKEQVFSKTEFKEWANKHAVLLEIDFPRKKKQSRELKLQNGELENRFGVTGYPTILILDASGKKLGEPAYDKGGPGIWIAQAEKVIAKK